MTDYTPGPWRFSYLTAGDVGVCADKRGLILNVSQAGQRINGGMTRGEEEANARLIAAAPEMLEACRNLLRSLDAGTFRPIVQDDPEHGGWRLGNLDLMRELVAKAEGSAE